MSKSLELLSLSYLFTGSHICRARICVCCLQAQHQSELQMLWRTVGGRQKVCLLTRKLVVFLQLPCFVQLCSAAGAQHECYNTEDSVEPGLKFQKKEKETNRPLTGFNRYIVHFPACLFDQTKPFLSSLESLLLTFPLVLMGLHRISVILVPCFTQLDTSPADFFFYPSNFCIIYSQGCKTFLLRLIDKRKQKWNFQSNCLGRKSLKKLSDILKFYWKFICVKLSY